jgi:hypothetical protein
MDLDEYIRRANEYTSDQYANDFINLLSKYKPNGKDDKFYLTINREVNVIRPSGYYAYISFKNLVCELFHRAIKSIPNIISEYTITCRNSEGTTMIKLGLFDDLDDDGEKCVAKVVTPTFTYCLCKNDVHAIFVANRTNQVNEEVVTSLMVLLYGTGDEPILTTSWVSAKTFKKEKY